MSVAFSGDNPVKKVKIPKVDNKRLRFLTVDEAEALLIALKKESIETWEMALISLDTGLRASEIFPPHSPDAGQCSVAVRYMSRVLLSSARQKTNESHRGHFRDIAAISIAPVSCSACLRYRRQIQFRNPGCRCGKCGPVWYRWKDTESTKNDRR